MNKKIYKLLIGLTIALFFVFFTYVGFFIIKHLSAPDVFRTWVIGHGLFGYLAYILMTTIQIVACVVPGEPFELLSGYAFGAIEGTLLCLLAESMGSIVVIALTRKYGKKLVHLFFSDEKINKLKFLKNKKNKFIIFAVLFIIPGTPKDFLCYVAGLTDIAFIPLAIVCSIGRIPSIVTSTILGGSIGDKDYTFAFITLFITIALSCIGLLIYKKFNEKNKTS